MAVDESFREYVEDLLAPFGEIRTKPMMGGLMVWEGPDPFALVTSDQVICFKVDDETRPDYEAAGSIQYKSMPYWDVPGDVLDDPDRLSEWAAKAIAAGHRTAGKQRS